MLPAGLVAPCAPASADDSVLGGVARGWAVEPDPDESGFRWSASAAASVPVTGRSAAKSARGASPVLVVLGAWRSSRIPGFSSAVSGVVSPLVKPAPGGAVPQLLASTE